MRAFMGTKGWQWPAMLALSAALAACGKGSGGSSTTAPVTPTPTVQVSLLAGSVTGMGNTNGPAASATFNLPQGIASDSKGNLFIVDSANCVIRKLDTTGIVSTFAGYAGYCAYDDGTGSSARFSSPNTLAIDSNDNLFVIDQGGTTIREIMPTGVVTTFAGVAGSSGSNDTGTNTIALFNNAKALAVDTSVDTVSGNIRNYVYVADTDNNEIRKITPTGTVTTFAGQTTAGSADGASGKNSFKAPAGLTVDSSGNVYVADTGNNTIRLITTSGTVSTLAGTAGSAGYVDGTGLAARFSNINDLVMGSDGNIYGADLGNDVIRKVTPAGVVSTYAGVAGQSGTTDGALTASQFSGGFHLAYGSTAGVIYVAEAAFNKIRQINVTKGLVSTIAGQSTNTGYLDGTGSAARMGSNLSYAIIPVNLAPRPTLPTKFVVSAQGVAADNAGNIYVADSANRVIRKITPAGKTTTLAGSAGVAGNADGTGSAASFVTPSALAVDASGNVYVTDPGSQTIRKITSGGVVTTLAGVPQCLADFSSCSKGYVDGAGAQAQFFLPTGIAVDAVGNVYVADSGNQVIRKITPTGQVSTVAGTVFNTGNNDGSATSAAFNWPQGLAVDAQGNIFVADTQNDAIRKISNGVVTTFAGGSSGASDGKGTAAMFHLPRSLSFDSQGNLYVSDDGNSLIRKVAQDGTVTTVLGQAGLFAPQLGTIAGIPSLPPLHGVAVLPNGQLAISAAQGVLVVKLP